MKKTKIVCTLGPASDTLKTIKNMISSGMNVARCNMSHGTVDSHTATIRLVQQAREELGQPCAVMVDTRGPELRIGTFGEGKVMLKKDSEFTFTIRQVVGTDKIVTVKYKKIIEDVKKGDKIFVNNGLVEFKVKNVTDTDIICKTINGGMISNNKSMCVPGIKLRMPYLNDNDKAALRMAVDVGAEMVAISFVSEASEVNLVRKYLKSIGGNQLIISKIENAEGIRNIESIIEASDGIMVARGDMGTEILIEHVPAVQKQIIKETIIRGKMVITATEMLESMTEQIRPTRAETTDVANAIYDGTSATMLSGETAAGKYPVETVQTMSKIAVATENVINYNAWLASSFDFEDDLLNAISYSACLTARSLGSKVIVCFTNSGRTARMISRFRPQADILAVTHDKEVYNSLALSWGVIPVLADRDATTDEMFLTAIKLAKDKRLVKKGDSIVITSGVPAKDMGMTNLIKITTI